MKEIAIDIEAYEERMRAAIKADKEKHREIPICKWCESKHVRVLMDNGIKGKGYAIRECVCNDCGRIQPKMKVTLTFEIPNHGFDVVEKPLEAINHAIRTLSEEVPIGQVEAEFCNCNYLDNDLKHSKTCPTHIKQTEVDKLIEKIF